jgi:aryl-alcohol dehydrogenase-like predicted oxidoreductase
MVTIAKSTPNKVASSNMEFVSIPGTSLKVSRIGLGTWAIGGWMWGGTDDHESIRTIQAALDQGINLIDTAPVYGFGHSEEVVGKALATNGRRQHAVIATKTGLEWKNGKPFRNASRARIVKEVEDSLRRLQTDVIDVYQVHWPDPAVLIEETAAAMAELHRAGKIRAVGVSNFSPAQMNAFAAVAPLHTAQPPYNLFEREIERDVLPYCRDKHAVMLGYGALCRGLLSGRMTEASRFSGDDLRKSDPKFEMPRFRQYLDAVRSTRPVRPRTLWKASDPSGRAVGARSVRFRCGALGGAAPRSVDGHQRSAWVAYRRAQYGRDRSHTGAQHQGSGRARVHGAASRIGRVKRRFAESLVGLTGTPRLKTSRMASNSPSSAPTPSR